MTNRLLSRARAHAGKLLVGLLLLAGLAFAGIDLEAYSELLTAPTPVTVSSGESLVKDTPIRPRAMRGNPSIYLAPTFSVAGATATFEIDMYRRVAGVNTWAGTALITTATGSTSRTVDSGRYPANAIIVADGYALPIYDVRVTNISSGTVRFGPWVGAADTTPSGSTDNQ